MRRKLFSVHSSAKQSRGLALSVVLLLAFCSSANSQPARLNVSYSSESPGSLPVWIAATARPEEFTEISFIKEFDDNGFVDSLYRK